MIKSRRDYRYYLEADRLSLGRPKKRIPLRIDPIWRYQRLLRKREYYENCRKVWWTWGYRLFLRRWWNHVGMKLGYSLALNVFGPGLCLAHPGTVVVNDLARVGKNCRVHVCVNIGCQAGEPSKTPVIGDNVYIGPGAKIFGGIRIADGIAIGANAVVNYDFLEADVTIAGVPAKKISENGAKGLLIRGTEKIEKREG